MSDINKILYLFYLSIYICITICLIEGDGEVNTALCFTAMSRVRKLEDLAFTPSIPNYQYFCGPSSKSAGLKSRIEEERRKQELSRILLRDLATGQEPTCSASEEAI